MKKILIIGIIALFVGMAVMPTSTAEEAKNGETNYFKTYTIARISGSIHHGYRDCLSGQGYADGVVTVTSLRGSFSDVRFFRAHLFIGIISEDSVNGIGFLVNVEHRSE